MKLYKVYPDESMICGSCGGEKIIFYTLADSEEEAKELLKKGLVLCGACIAEMIADKRYEILSKEGNNE